MMKYYFNSTKGSLNNRPSHQLIIGPNWSWMSFSKLPHFLDALCTIIVTSHHFPVFQNENGNVIFV